MQEEGWTIQMLFSTLLNLLFKFLMVEHYKKLTFCLANLEKNARRRVDYSNAVSMGK